MTLNDSFLGSLLGLPVEHFRRNCHKNTKKQSNLHEQQKIHNSVHSHSSLHF